MTVQWSALATMFLCAAASAASAADIRVPRDHANLRDALLAAQAGDRIVVTGGSFRNGRITKADVTLVGSGTRLSGAWEFTASGAVVEGITFSEAVVTVTGDLATFRRCAFVRPPQVKRVAQQFSATDVTGLLIEDCRVAGMDIFGYGAHGTILRRNRVTGGQVGVHGELVLVEDNTASRNSQFWVQGGGAVFRRNRAGYLWVGDGSDRSVFEDNFLTGGLFATGNAARMVRNRLTNAYELSVVGDDAVIADNEVSFRGQRRHASRGLTVQGARARVTDNRISGDRSALARFSDMIIVSGPGPAVVSRNEITHVAGRGIVVRAPGSTVSSNVLHGASCQNSIDIETSSCAVTENVVEQTGSRSLLGSGIAVTGDGNALTDNKVEGARYDGIIIGGDDCTLDGNEVRDSGRCGITIDEEAHDTTLTDCIVTGARWAALFLLGDDASVVRGSFTGGERIDVLDLGRRTELVGPTFGTKTTDEGYKPFK